MSYLEYGTGRGLQKYGFPNRVIAYLKENGPSNYEVLNAVFDDTPKTSIRGTMCLLKSRGFVQKKKDLRWEIVEPSE